MFTALMDNVTKLFGIKKDNTLPEVTDDKPLKTLGLTIYPNRFRYKKKKFSFSDIEHIGWHWVSKTTNGIINTQTVELKIFIRNGKIISLRTKTLYSRPKLVDAYMLLSDRTFENRLHFYTRQLEESGSFTYKNKGFFKNKNIIFYTNGDVEYDGKIFKLSNAEIEAFSLRIWQGGILSPKLKIKLEIDKDVIMALISFIIENKQDPSQYVKNAKQQKKSEEELNEFLLNVISLMAKLSFADGIVSQEEVDVVEDFLLNGIKVNESKLSQMMVFFTQAKNSPIPFEQYAINLANNETDILHVILDALFLIAIADGYISAEEELLLLEVEDIFGIKGKMYHDFKNQSFENTNNKKEFYLNILGLELDATQQDIKKAYRRLAMKFHPDRMIHMSEEFFIEAEMKMKQINEAYEYLKDT